ncbi:uncharacterized protein DUF3866 [Aneurinibacillus soli]|uniref:Uncharacterized protein n=1 Tax=Aneurinibacillus soli TaxID=1500254 RepID=A0A0U5AZD5_9BACL|nr:DUF3866 family protein [Aneurinibacillus soli]PYE62812.1 uncharacterized protein DUF3866 [Aneurinibacillus soli]BAU29130.1 hypothetical protein CB4_03308 [Aneurinibacillus soli]
MITWAYGTVLRIVRTEKAMQEIKVEIEGEEARALHYPQWLGEVEEGEQVLLNTTAVTLGLGSGGYHFVAARSDEKDIGTPLQQAHRQSGHIMKGRYTPFQHAVLAAEEPDSPHHAQFAAVEEDVLKGMPVVVGELHSMLPAFALALHNSKGRSPYRLVYIMSEGGAQPLALSQHVRALRQSGRLCAAITYGHGFGGDSECVNLYTALAAARLVWQADVVIVAPGPGTVGTATPFGFSGMEQIAIVQAVRSLGGIPILLPRVSKADKRTRHQGISHHTQTVLRFLRETPLVINTTQELVDEWGEQSVYHTVILHETLPAERWEELTADYEIPLITMNRGVEEDGLFFAHMYYAACFLRAMDFSSPLWFNKQENAHYLSEMRLEDE